MYLYNKGVREHIYNVSTTVPLYLYPFYVLKGGVVPNLGTFHLTDDHQQHQDTEKQIMIHVSWLHVMKLNISDG